MEQKTDELTAFTIELSAMVQARMTITVEAVDLEAAKEAALVNYSGNPRDWEVIDGGFIDDIEPVSYYTDEQDKWIDF